MGAADAHQHLEWEEWLDPEIWSRVVTGKISSTDLPLPPSIITALADQPIEAIGGFCNQRMCFDYRQEPIALLCLDRTDFDSDHIDYELEIECNQPQACAQHWGQQLADWRIPYAPQPLTKFARFLRYAGEQ
jgi:uncharacterized protein YjbK